MNQMIKIRATLIKAFFCRDLGSFKTTASTDSKTAIFEDWDALFDWRGGLRIGRGYAPGLAALFLDVPLALTDPDSYERLIERTRDEFGLSEREARTVAALEGARAAQAKWDWESKAGERRILANDEPLRLAVERDRRRVERSMTLDERTEYKREKAARRKRFGLTRPKELWHDIVATLRRDVKLTPIEIKELANVFRGWWGTTSSALNKAIAKAATPAQRSRRAV